MSGYCDLKKFCKENSVTMEQLDNMWKYMYDKNWKVKKLTDDGISWTTLNSSVLKSLIDLYKKEIIENEIIQKERILTENAIKKLNRENEIKNLSRSE